MTKMKKKEIVLRSSRIWSQPKRKLGPNTVYYKGFKILSDGTHTYYLCTTKFNQKEGDFVYCEFTQRKDRVFSENDLQHTCWPPSKNIIQYGKIINNDEPEDNQILTHHITFVGKSNMSMTAAVSPEFYALIHSAISVGQQNTAIKPANLYPQVSRSTFTKRFIEYGLEKYQAMTNNFKKYKYNSLSIDAGKEGSKNYLDIILTNAIIPLKPILFQAIQLFDGSYNSYYRAIRDAILTLSACDICITGIVCDGLRVQKKAVDDLISYFNGTFVRIPCSCHCLQLSIKDFLAHELLEDALKCIEIFSSTFNSKPVASKFKLVCPSRCLTRWNNIFDICEFVIKNFKKIEDFMSQNKYLNLSPFQKNDTIINSCIRACKIWSPLLYILFYPFKLLTEKLEGDNVTAGYIYGYSESAAIFLEQLTIQYDFITDKANLLLSLIRERFDYTVSGHLLSVLFHLTPKGRRIYISKNDLSIDELKQLYSDLFPLERSQNLMDKAADIFTKQDNYFQKIINNQDDIDYDSDLSSYDNPYEDAGENVTILNSGIANEYNQNSNQQNNEQTTSTNNDGIDFHNDQEQNEEETNNEAYGSNDSSITENIDEIAKDYFSLVLFEDYEEVDYSQDSVRLNFDLEGQIILEQANILGLDADSATRAYSAWLEDTDPLLSDNMKRNIREDDIYSTWKFFEKCQNFQPLALIALRLLSISASEAAAERMFWKQRKIITGQRSKTSEPLQMARLALMNE